MSPMEKAPVTVTVRMYCGIFGDCFLLRFTDREDRSQYALIDCGVYQTTRDREAVVTKIARDVMETTRGRLLLLAVTHEHMDHISGFVDARATFEGKDPDCSVKQKLTAESVWLSWAEDPADELAQQLKAQYGPRELALTQIAAYQQGQHRPIGSALATLAARVGGLSDKQSAMQWVAQLRLPDKPDYLRPREVRALPGVEGVRAFVLGPPHVFEQVGRLDAEREEYPRALSPTSSFLAAATATLGLQVSDAAPTWEEAEELQFPFAEHYRIPEQPRPEAPRPSAREEARLREQFRTRYRVRSDEWRTIDGDWLGVAGELALNLQTKTNNTSLVLAFEIGGEKGGVLLFPGDAQAGNWLSWDDLAWPDQCPSRPGGDTFAGDLLRRTVLYKVGHHGSRNATMADKGLERMSSEQLAAMVPVDNGVAQHGTFKSIPCPPLMRRLSCLTKSRLIRGDRPPSLAEQAALGDRLKEKASRLYVEYTIG